MKIAKIIIKNYRGIEDLTINAEDINVFLGTNGVGKTSTLQAIRYVLTGQGDVDDIRMDADEMSVEIIFEDTTSIRRIRKSDKNEVKVNGKNTTIKACNEFLEQKFGCSKNVLEAMCSADFFKSLDKKDLTNFILSILPIQVSYNKLIEFCEEKIGRKLDSDEKKFLDGCFDTTTATIGLSDIELVYQKVFARRKLEKSNLKVMQAKANFDINKLPEEAKETLEKELSRIQVIEAQAVDIMKQMDAYKKSLEARKIAEEKLQQLKMEFLSYVDISSPDEQELITAKEDKQKFINAISKYKTILGTNRTNIEMYERTLVSLDKPVCPLSEKLICQTDKSGLKASLQELVRENNDSITKINEFIAKCEEQVTMRDKIIDKYNENIVKWTKKEALEKQIKDFVLPDILDKPKDIPTEDVMGKKTEIQAKLSIYAEYDTAISYEKKCQEQLKLVNMLEFAVNILDVKNGVRCVILEKSLNPIESMVNIKAETLRKGFNLILTSPNGIDIRVAPKGNKYVPLEKVSSGEFIFVAYLLMSVIREITGVSVLIIDDIDKLDTEATETFIKILKSDKEYENVFIGGVNHSDTAKIIEAVKVNVINY